jgi:hypothetical protein
VGRSTEGDGCIFIGAFACYRLGDGHFRDVPQVALFALVGCMCTMWGGESFDLALFGLV